MRGAVLCDLDGVIRIWSPGDTIAIEAGLGLPGGAILGAAFQPGILGLATTGAISDGQWRTRTADALAAKYGESGRTAVVEWSKLTGSIDQAMLEVVSQVRARVPVVLVTNATSRLDDDLATLGLLDAFDHVANSSELGVAKPAPEIFHEAAALAGVDLAACVVIDDQAGHVDAARKAGAVAIHHTNPARTRRSLEALGLDPAS